MRITARIDISPLDPAGTYLLCARWGHQSEIPSGALGKRPRTGPLMDGDGVNLDHQDMRDGLAS